MQDKKTIAPPNIFSLATKELSQDAVIAWLMQWADQRHAVSGDDVQSALNRCGKALLVALLEKGGHKPSSINEVEADVQWNRIDIWAIVNKEFFIIIEDKTYTSARETQLEDYLEKAQKYAQGAEAKNKYGRALTVVPIYLKIAEEMQQTLKKVKSKHYHHFSRQDLLVVLSEYRPEWKFIKHRSEPVQNLYSSIVPDFWNYLVQIDKEHDWKNIVLKDWTKHTWMAFYAQLEEDGITDYWHKVDNRSGGFQNALLSYDGLDGYPLYLQIEQDSLAFKVKSKRDFDRSEEEEIPFLDKSKMMVLLNNSREWLLSVASSLEKEKRPVKTHKRVGKWMTIARVEQENWMGDVENTISYPAVIAQLQVYMDFLATQLRNAKAEKIELIINSET